MIIELVILAILLSEECTIYKIKKKTDKYFFLFYLASLGSIHPALKKLYSAKYVNVKNSISSGGQKSSGYSITKQGRKYFEELMIQELPKNPALAKQLVNIKLLLLPKLEKSLKKEAIEVLKDYFQNRLLDFENFHKNLKTNENSGLSINYIKHSINQSSENIRWLDIQEFM